MLYTSFMFWFGWFQKSGCSTFIVLVCPGSLTTILSSGACPDLSSVREKTKERGRDGGRSYCSGVFSYKDYIININL